MNYRRAHGLHFRTLLSVLTGIFLFIPSLSFAQEADAGKLSITIAPPLYQLTIAPGTLWRSTLRIVNTNHYPLRISAEVTDFHPSGETGNAVFDSLPPGGKEDTRRMSGWITLPSGEIVIPPDKSYEIPFSITVPQNADPGGHYAAILVGTLPPEHTQGSGASVGTTLSSLIFLRVPGEVVEEGLIRDFYAAKDVVSSPTQSFVLRFENKGNVHLVPQGEIAIVNMWGKKRGTIVVNEKSSFGNVLPRSTRRFAFEWKGEPSVFDIGRYRAEAVLSYGEGSKQSAVRTTYFWIIPWKPVTLTLLSVLFFIWFFTWSIRRYVQNALRYERERIFGSAPERGRSMPLPTGKESAGPNINREEPKITLRLLKQPLVMGATALPRGGVGRMAPSRKEENSSEKSPRTYIEWARTYRAFLYFVFVFILACSLVGWYFVEVFEEERAFQVTEIRPRG